ncbi:hypothetical protein CTI12_AA302900 [Artemisia annua]|uniref:Helitron helicase-like domain-containing protein n=1 Tax=Artemisia annua TaxID=35608 RepID=A0A2U1N5R0_ARTAN|nr:hypothetical protein CTI12_AA302900 [Artemisia annua]
MKVKRKAVPNRAAKDIPIQTSHPLGSHSFCHYEVSTLSSVNDLGVRHVGHDGAGWVSFPVVSTGIQSNGASSLSCCDSAAASSSRDISTMEIGDEGGGYVVVNAGQNSRLNEAHLLDPVLPCQVDRPDVVGDSSVYNAGCAGHVPMVLDFSAGHVVRSPNFSASAQPNNNMNARQIGIPARPTRQPGQPCMRNPDAPPVQGPIAPPQREGAPLDYKCFGRYNQYQRCCAAGHAVLRTHEQYPPYITQLFSDKHFMENIRAYNQMFAITSFGATIDNSINTGRSPYVFRVSGQIYHWIGSFCPQGDDTPRFLQLYIYDRSRSAKQTFTL